MENNTEKFENMQAVDPSLVAEAKNIQEFTLPNDLPEERQQSILSAMEQIKHEDIDLRKPKVFNTTPVNTNAAPESKTCQHCGWDLNKPSPDEPTDNDKLIFLQSILGQKRFYKSYPLLNGKLNITFRTLTAEESDTCHTQVAYDVEAGYIIDAGSYFRTLADYKLCLGIARIELGTKVIRLPELEGYKTETLAPKTTKLKQIVPYVYDKVLVQDSIRRASGVTYVRFEQLVNLLADRLDNTNFWPVIEEQV